MFAGYFTTRVSEIGKLFVEPAGVADGVTVRVYVPLGVMTCGGGGCTELTLLPPPQPFSTSVGTPAQRLPSNRLRPQELLATRAFGSNTRKPATPSATVPQPYRQPVSNELFVEPSAQPPRCRWMSPSP
jgi:hypothetical protein